MVSLKFQEIVPLRKICRRPETEYRLRILQATRAQAMTDPGPVSKDASPGYASKDQNAIPQREEKHQNVDANSQEVIKPAVVPEEPVATDLSGPTASESDNRAASNFPTGDHALASVGCEIPQEGKTAAE